MKTIIKTFRIFLWGLGLAVILWGIPTNARAQWMTNGSNIYYNNGNAGIGTPSPGKKLDVPTGQVRFGGVVMGTFGDEVITSETDVGGSGKKIQIKTLGGDGTGITIATSGNVGIGTTTSSEKLDVVGNIKVNKGTLAVSLLNGGEGLWVDATTDNNPYITLTDDGPNTGGKVGYDAAADALVLGHHTKGNVLYMKSSGNVGIGITNPSQKLHVQGNASVTGDMIVDGNIAAKYQDVAEWVPVKEAIMPGTVVSLDEENINHVKPAGRSYDIHVAGVVSAQPGILLGEQGKNKVAVATTGRVKVKATTENGSIHIGDIMVTSDKRGSAMRSIPIDVGGEQIHRPGTVVGKALEPLEKGDGEIMVLLTLQ